MTRRSIYNDDSQGVQEARPESAEQDLRDWVDKPLSRIPVDTYAWCIAYPDIVHFESKIGEVQGRRFDKPRSDSEAALEALRSQGKDVMHIVADQAHRHGVEVVASMRMNDTHQRQPDPNDSGVPQLLLDHPEYAIKRNDGIQETALDYSFSEVRSHRLGILTELAEQYEIDGVELDFTRWAKLFVREEAPFKIAIMTEFVGQVRQALDEAARKRGRDRLVLGVQVPSSLYLSHLCGLDPRTWIERDWLDYLIQCDWNCTDPQMPVAEFAEMCRDRRCTHHVRMGNMMGGRWTGKPYFDQRRTAYKNARGYHGMVLTPEEARGAAANAYGFGSDGIGLWNLCCAMGDSKHDAHAGVDRKQFQEDMIEWACAVARPETVWADRRVYHFLPIYKGEIHMARNYPVNAVRTGPAGEPVQIVIFYPYSKGFRQIYRFVMADGKDGQKLVGTLRFRILQSTLEDRFALDINGSAIDAASVKQEAVADEELPYVWYEVGLADCPAFRGVNELGMTPQEFGATPARPGTLYEMHPYMEELIVTVEP